MRSDVRELETLNANETLSGDSKSITKNTKDLKLNISGVVDGLKQVTEEAFSADPW